MHSVAPNLTLRGNKSEELKLFVMYVLFIYVHIYIIHICSMMCALEKKTDYSVILCPCGTCEMRLPAISIPTWRHLADGLGDAIGVFQGGVQSHSMSSKQRLKQLEFM